MRCFEICRTLKAVSDLCWIMQVWAMEMISVLRIISQATLSSSPSVSCTSSPPSPVSCHGKNATRNWPLNVCARLLDSLFQVFKDLVYWKFLKVYYGQIYLWYFKRKITPTCFSTSGRAFRFYSICCIWF